MSDAKHSGIGIASFVTGLDAFLFFFFTLILAVAISGIGARGRAVETLTGMFVFLLIFLALLGLGLGIGGLCQPDRRKIFPILGITFSSLTLLLTVTIIAIGGLAH